MCSESSWISHDETELNDTCVFIRDPDASGNINPSMVQHKHITALHLHSVYITTVKAAELL